MTFDGSAPRIEQAPLREIVDQRAARTAGLTQKVFEWLAVSPNNPGYHDSDAYKLPRAWLDAHYSQINDYVADGMQNITMDNAAIDLYQLEMIHSGAIPHVNQYTGEIEPLHSEFAVSDFMNAGIGDILERARDDSVLTPLDEMRYHAVEAVGAMLVRGIYFTRLSVANSEAFPEAEREGYLRIFQQNILATIRRAARLELEQKAASEQQPAPQASEQLAVAA
jgi:hypothetical protein